MCAIDGCERPVKSRGLCQAHYRRKLRCGEVGRDRKPCSVDGCGSSAVSKGYCSTHYQRLLKYGRLHTVKVESLSALHCGKEYCPATRKLVGQLAYLVNREKRKESARRWKEANKDRHRGQLKKYHEKYPWKKTVRTARRRAALINATPPWLTKEHLVEIKVIYKKAARLTAARGEPYEVDHIVPLQGGTVCGLHVPWNLRILHKSDNNKRPRIWDPNNPDIQIEIPAVI